jgi:hypothetical protein
MSSTETETMDGLTLVRRPQEDGDPMILARFSGLMLPPLGTHSMSALACMQQLGSHPTEQISLCKTIAQENHYGRTRLPARMTRS